MPSAVPVDYDPFARGGAAFADTPGALPLTSQDQASRFVDKAGQVATSIADPFMNLATLAGRAAYGPESEGWGRYGPATPEDAAKGALLLTMPGLGRAAMAPATENALGIFGGRLAKTADLDALKTAQTMEAKGVYSDDIWKATGWGKGADGQWRFEIPDKASSMGTWPAKQFESGQMPSKMAAGVLEHPELYKAYPELGSTQISATKAPTAEGSLGYGSMIVKAPSTEEARSIMLHEMQHGVQGIEGFSPGTDPVSMYAQKGQYPSGYEAYRAAAGEVESRNVQARRNMAPNELRDLPPSYTQDIPNSRQIVLPGKGGISRAEPVDYDPFAGMGEAGERIAVVPRMQQAGAKYATENLSRLGQLEPKDLQQLIADAQSGKVVRHLSEKDGRQYKAGMIDVYQKALTDSIGGT